MQGYDRVYVETFLILPLLATALAATLLVCNGLESRKICQKRKKYGLDMAARDLLVLIVTVMMAIPNGKCTFAHRPMGSRRGTGLPYGIFPGVI